MNQDVEVSPVPCPGGAHFPAVLEADQRLSRSLLWGMQRAYFERAGIEAWQSAAVPHQVTNNPLLARAYAEVFLGFLRDCGDLPGNPSEPVTIVELCAGSGRFAYLFLQALTDLLRRSRRALPRFRYVMTDLAEKNVDRFRGHEALLPFVEQGLLDFARFDAEHDRELRLVGAGVDLFAGGLTRPLGVIANYAFDVLPQDAFLFQGGELHELLLTIAAPEPALDLAEPGALARLRLEHAPRAASLDYYAEPELNAILRGYASRLEGQTILFPVAAARCLARLEELAGGRLFVLSGDRGQIHESGLPQQEGLGMALHGDCFSLDVNFHALGEYVRGRGGQVLAAGHQHTHLLVSAFALGEHPSGWAETRLGFSAAVERRGPDDFYSLQWGIYGHHQQLSLEVILSLIRMSAWDLATVNECIVVLWKHLPGAPDATATEVIQTVMRAWEGYFHIGEPTDLPFELALLLHAYGGHAEALELFQASLRLYGDSPKTRWNIALCHWALGLRDEALAGFADVAASAPSFVPAGALQVK